VSNPKTQKRDRSHEVATEKSIYSHESKTKIILSYWTMAHKEISPTGDVAGATTKSCCMSTLSAPIQKFLKSAEEISWDLILCMQMCQ
jgi:hypothetical protein